MQLVVICLDDLEMRRGAEYEQDVADLHGEIERLRPLENSAADPLTRDRQEGEAARLRPAPRGR